MPQSDYFDSADELLRFKPDLRGENVVSTLSRALIDERGKMVLRVMPDGSVACARSGKVLVDASGEPVANVGTTAGTVAAGDDPRIVGALQPENPGTVMPRVDYVGATDRTADLQAAFNAVRTLGDTITLPAGRIYIRYPDLLHIDRPCHVRGQGMGRCSNVSGDGAAYSAGFHDGGTTIITDFVAPANGNFGHLIKCNAPVSWSDLSIVNLNPRAQAPTAGTGIFCVDSTTARYTRVLIAGFWDGLNIDGGYMWGITDCFFVSMGNAYLTIRDRLVHDGDDSNIKGTNFAGFLDRADGRTHILHCSGGGLYIDSTCKFVAGAAHAYELALDPGVTTSDLRLDGSFELLSDYAVLLTAPDGASAFSNVRLNGQFAGNKGGIKCDTNQVSEIKVSGDAQFKSMSEYSVWAIGGNAWQIGEAMHSNVAGGALAATQGQPASVLGAVRFGAGANYRQVRSQFLPTGGVAVIQDPGNSTGIRHDYATRVITAAGASHPTFEVTLNPYYGGLFELSVQGSVSGVGTCTQRIIGAFAYDGNGTVVSVDQNTTHGAGAGHVSVALTVVGGSLLRALVTSDAIGGFDGECYLAIKGNVNAIAKYL